MKKLLLLALVGTFPLSANASFELALVLDRATKKVHRFDASTGAYFGSFGNFVQPQSLSINKANNEVIVYDPGAASTYHFNYNTGLMSYASTNWSVSLNQVGHDPTNNGYVAINPAVTGFFFGSFDMSNIVLKAIGTGSTTRYDNIDSNRLMLVQAGTTLRMVNWTTKATVTLATTTATIADYAQTGQTTPSGRIGALARTDGSLATVAIGASSISFGGEIASTSSGFTSFTAVAPLHTGAIAIGTAPGGGALMRTFAFGAGNGLSNSKFLPIQTINLASAGITQPIDVATVVAPEPATLAALGFGVFAALRRRRKQGS